MLGGLQGWHLVIIILLAVVLFGAPKLPGMARSIGQSLRIFKSEVKQMKDENNNDRATDTDPVEGRVMDSRQQPYNPVQDPSRPQGNPSQYRADGPQSGNAQGYSHQNGNPPAGT